MISNSYKIKKGNNGNSIFSLLDKVISLHGLAEQGLPLRFFPYILFLTAVAIFYIGNNHHAEKTIRKINRLEVEVEELRADYTSLKADYMFDSKQSEVAKKVIKIGLEESLEPPYKIVLKKGEY
ncbi:MAG: FtsL-like putative cell division protein [Candidatus Cyclobacteriaceae bacterium M3_2C_046]